MKTYKFLVVLCAALAFTPGCQLFAPKPGITYEATVFMSFRDTWTVTRAAYSGWMDRVARGKVSDRDAADVNMAWEKFRGAFLIACEAAQWKQDEYTPEHVRKLAQDVLTLISATP